MLGISSRRYASELGSKSQVTIAMIVLTAFKTLGVIYGDIGTSPLYVFNGVLESDPDKHAVIGALSCILWSLTLIPLIKYCFIVLHAGESTGEGGTFVLWVILARFLRLEPSPADDDSLVLTLAETRASALSFSPSRCNRGRLIRQSKLLQCTLLSLTALGASFVAADGLLTPAVSILSAIEGIRLPAPSITDGQVVGISCGIVVALFLSQRLGTERISFLFSPAVLLWLISLLTVGIFNIAKYQPSIFKAFNPAYAVNYLVKRNDLGVLSGVLLSVTGVEVMFADMGHFTPGSIRLAFSVLVYPALCIAYMGQAAYLIHHPETLSTIFYSSIPGSSGGGIYWVIFVLATLATIIASQAMITGVFSIVHQAVQLECFPAVSIRHTRSQAYGQIYVPSVNYIMMIGVLAVIGGFSTSSNVTQAYGNAVGAVMLVTTILLTINIYVVYGLPWILSVLFFSIFGAVDTVFWLSTMKKVPHGAWFPLSVGVLLASFMLLWKCVAVLKYAYERAQQVEISSLVPQTSLGQGESGDYPDPEKQEIRIEVPDAFTTSKVMADSDPVVHTCTHVREAGVPRIGRFPGLALYYSSMPNLPARVPATITKFLKHFPMLQQSFVFISIRTAKVAHIPESERIVVRPYVKYPTFYKAIARYGFMDPVHIDSAFEDAIKSAVSEYQLDKLDGSTIVTHIVTQTLVRATLPSDQSLSFAKKINLAIRHTLIDNIYAPIAATFPDKNKWLLPEERTVVLESVASL